MDEKGRWSLASQMVSYLMRGKAQQAATEDGEDPPSTPAWERPASATELLGEEWLKKQFIKRPLTKDSLDAVWQVCGARFTQPSISL